MISSNTYRVLAHTLRLRFPMTPVHLRHECPLLPNSVPLIDQATFFDYVVLNGKRFYASRTVGSNKSALVCVLIPGEQSCTAYGEILEIFQISQALQGGDLHAWFARMRWFKPFQGAYDIVWRDTFVHAFHPLPQTNKICLSVQHLVYVYGN